MIDGRLRLAEDLRTMVLGQGATEVTITMPAAGAMLLALDLEACARSNARRYGGRVRGRIDVQEVER